MYKFIEPIIDLRIREMRKLPSETQKIICTCETPCDRFVTIDSLGRFCEYEAREIALGIFELVEDVKRVNVNEDKKLEGWSYAEDQLIIDWHTRNNGFKYGDTPKIAALLDRDLDKLRNHIKYLRRVGRL